MRWSAAVFALLLSSSSVLADSDDTINVFLSETVQHDDNLFRLSERANTLAVLGRSQRDDVLKLTTVGVNLRKAYGLQQVELNASNNAYRYDVFRYLDFDAFNYTATWRWKITPRLSGVIAQDRNQALTSFADFTAYGARNVRTYESNRATADWNVLGGWYLGAELKEDRQKQTQVFLAEPDYRLESLQGSVRYIFPSGSELAYSRRRGDGRNPRSTVDAVNLYDVAFRQREDEFRMTWPLSGKSRLAGRVTSTARSHPNVPARDFSKIGGRLDWNWTPTGKLQVDVSAGRNVTPYHTSFGSYHIGDFVMAGANWRATTKTSVRLQWTQTRLDYRGSQTAAGAGLAGRSDKIDGLQASASWAPYNLVTLSASLRKDSRGSSQAGLDYRAMVASLSAQISF